MRLFLFCICRLKVNTQPVTTSRIAATAVKDHTRISEEFRWTILGPLPARAASCNFKVTALRRESGADTEERAPRMYAD
ncbi:hypothetical protein [Edaphobacter modestus]|uniref:hypothetical protein n=1 Tax=Edaphobacter modestus TaxID=388466 RepID=UPI00102B4BB5|nr:hypothetical protein [Edaphobacter modestus]